MNILILDSWLREYLDTKVKPNELARCVSLCGPTFDRTDKIRVGGKIDYLYDIEVTTNRVDMMSVYGIAREAAVILPGFGHKARLKPLASKKPGTPSRSLPITIITNSKLTYRVMGIVLDIDKIEKSPRWVSDRLEASGIRSLNLPVDITNYVMTEVGHPMHVFDYDLVKPKMIIRESRKGEVITSLEDKKYTLEGGDIVIDNGRGEIIDLPGIIGTKNSIVNDDTKRILLFTETNDPVRIRKTSMKLDIRTNAAVLNEKGVDPNLAQTALYRGVELLVQLAKVKIRSKVHDSYNRTYESVIIKVDHQFIESRLGIVIQPNKVVKILTTLGFDVKHDKRRSQYSINPPPYRALDITIPEDIVEEVARIYGYHNLPSVLMPGLIPSCNIDSPFDFENEIKSILVGLGANEVYTNSLVTKTMAGRGALAIANPLGSDSSSMRTSLRPSLVEAAKFNNKVKDFHIFEMANVYIPQKGLPDETMMLAGVVEGKSYRQAKGSIEAFLENIRVESAFEQKDLPPYLPNHHLSVGDIGEFGILKGSNLFYYEFDVKKLRTAQKSLKYTPIPKYPAQIEDITLKLPERVALGDVIKSLKNVDDRVFSIEYIGKYKKYHTLRIYYQDSSKTLNNSEVNILRKKLLKKARSMNLVIKE